MHSATRQAGLSLAALAAAVTLAGCANMPGIGTGSSEAPTPPI